jgi:hypothetical protein
MRNHLAGALLLLLTATSNARELVYEGTWVTTNRPLDGTMTCVVTELAGNQWRGHFHGVWQGQAFSYTVVFTGSPEKLRGRAEIDGANYEWAGEMSTAPGGSFRGKFWGDRYDGSFVLKRVK